MKKSLRLCSAILAISLFMSLFLLGCGGSGGYSAAASSSAAYYARDNAMPSAPSPEAGSGFAGAEETEDAGEFVMPDSRKIIRHASMDLETREFDAALAEISRMVAESGGYLESQNQEGYSLGSSYRERYASMTARIPTEKLDGVVRSVGDLCNVLTQSETMDDITDTYYDSEARLEALRIQEERLLAILEKADKLEDIITLESALSDVRYQIESITASLRRMDSQVAYSYLNLSLREVVEYQKVQEKPKSFGERMGAAFQRGMSDMVDAVQSFCIFLAEAGPSLVLLILLVLAVILIVRACSRASQARRVRRGLPPKAPSSAAGYTTSPRAVPPPSFQRHPQRQTPEAPKDPGDTPAPNNSDGTNSKS